MQTEVLSVPSRVAAGVYARHFEQVEAQDWPPWLMSLRRDALDQFSDVGFPSVRHEDWRFTNVAPLAKLPFEPVLQRPRIAVAGDVLGKFHFQKLPGSRLIFIDGHYAPESSAPLALKDGTRAGSLKAALQGDTAQLAEVLSQEPRLQNPFVALNTAFFQDGAFVYLPPGSMLDAPVHVIFVSTAKQPGAWASPRNVFIAEKNSQATVIESYVSLEGAQNVTNAHTTIIAGESASFEHLKFQDESLSACHIAGLELRLQRSANLVAHSIALGAKLSRSNIHAYLGGEGIECVLNGLYLTRDDQLADHWMLVEHAKPHCNSHEYFNGILDDRSRGVFHGRILVQPEAQKTDAKQTNKNLLLSEDATADTKPQLEIYADDVKCTHGATIGQLNDESIFYLRSRGIGPGTARRILIHAFAGEIVERIRYEPVRDELDQIIWDRIEAHPHLA